MVVTIAWTHSWIAVSISLGVLLILMVFLLVCLCWDRGNSSEQHYYTLDENGMKKSADGGFFRRFSNAGVLKSNFRFATNANAQELKNSEKELMDSLDFDKQFSNSVLQIDLCDKFQGQTPGQEIDEWKSCMGDNEHSVISGFSDTESVNSI